MTFFNFNFPNIATEDENTPYEFTITPNAMLIAGYRVRWDIILDGQLPAGFNAFDALSGVVTFANGATIGQTITLPINDDTARGDVKSFSVRLTQIDADDQEAQIGTDQAISLTDNDIGEFAHISLSSTGEHDTLVAGSSYTYRSFTGAAGDDTMIITRFQTGNVAINDLNGQNIIKLDHGVQITDVDRDIFVFPGGGTTLVNSVTITLATGSEITISSPDSGAVGSKRYSYQIGDGALTDYAGFYAAITNGGFKEGDTGPLGKTFVVAYPVAGASTASTDTSTEILFTATLVDAATEDEDTPYEFTITPNAALTADYRVRWEIILDGQLSAGFNDFDTLSGVVTFASGATGGETVTLPINDDTARGDVKSFSVRLTQIDAGDQEVQIGTDQAISLTDDDMGEFAHISLSSTGEHDTLVTGSSYTYRAFTGAAGDDTMIITRFQTGDVAINDLNGQNIIKLDHGVQITDVDRDIFVFPGGGTTLVNSVTITLATGSEITISSPDSGAVGSKRYSFQLGDGVLTDYAGFYDAITDGGFKEGDSGPLTDPFDIPFPVAQPAALEITATLDDIIKGIIVGNTDVATLTVSGTANIADFTFTTDDARFIINGNIVQLMADDYSSSAADESVTITVTGLDDKDTAGETSDDVTITQSFTFSFLNDDNPAVISGDAKGEFDVSAQTVSGVITITDVDATPSITISNGGVGLYGTLSIDTALGEWTYTINPAATAVASLADYATLDESFTVTAGDDSNIHTIAINIDKLALPTKEKYFKWVEIGATLTEEGGETYTFADDRAHFLLFNAGTTPDDTSDDHVIREENYGDLNDDQFVILDDSLPSSSDGRPFDLDEFLTVDGNDVFVLEAGITRDIQISENTNGGYNIIKLGNDMTIVDAGVQGGGLVGTEHVITIDTDTSNDIATDTIEIIFSTGIDNIYFYDENVFDSVNSLLTDFA